MDFSSGTEPLHQTYILNVHLSVFIVDLNLDSYT